MIVDSHCHLGHLADPDAALARARSRQIAAFLCIGVDESDSRMALELAEMHLDVWASIGQHPAWAHPDTRLDWIEPLARHKKVVAVGETGLDYLQLERSTQPCEGLKRAQRDCFARHLAIARDLMLPVVVHTRDAEQDTLDLLRREPDVRGVLHCFTESWKLASAALDLGYYISISGIVTFRNADNLRDIARRVPEERLLVETDCPWLAPEPHRGKANEPGFVADTLAYLAELRGVRSELLAARTSENFYRLFRRARVSVSRKPVV